MDGCGLDWSMAFVQNALFDVGRHASARAFHECKTHQRAALRWLRSQDLPKVVFERQNLGSRLAPAIDKLRNGWGFDIEGDGTKESPYTMPDRGQWPSMAAVTGAMEAAYYDSEHWKKTSRKRLEYDKFCCVFCTCSEPAVQVHHIKYDLFSESLDQLISVCIPHHQMIHDNSRIGFPIGVDVSIAEKLLGVVSYDFEDWLKPIKVEA